MTTAKYPPEIRELWPRLQAEVVWLHGRWILYRQLFGTSPARITILNTSASTFFRVIQFVLLNDVQLSLGKLGDPAGDGSRKNMSLNRLHAEIDAAGDTKVAAALRADVEAFKSACSKLRKRRNKSIAHFDLRTMLKSGAKPMKGPSREEIENALEKLRGAMDTVQLAYAGSVTAYEHFHMQHDGEALLNVLMRGLRYRELVSDGVVPREDLWGRFRDEE